VYPGVSDLLPHQFNKTRRHKQNRRKLLNNFWSEEDQEPQIKMIYVDDACTIFGHSARSEAKSQNPLFDADQNYFRAINLFNWR